MAQYNWTENSIVYEKELYSTIDGKEACIRMMGGCITTILFSGNYGKSDVLLWNDSHVGYNTIRNVLKNEEYLSSCIDDCEILINNKL